jgi:hypothetical protein
MVTNQVRLFTYSQSSPEAGSRVWQSGGQSGETIHNPRQKLGHVSGRVVANQVRLFTIPITSEARSRVWQSGDQSGETIHNPLSHQKLGHVSGRVVTNQVRLFAILTRSWVTCQAEW